MSSDRKESRTVLPSVLVHVYQDSEDVRVHYCMQESVNQMYPSQIFEKLKIGVLYGYDVREHVRSMSTYVRLFVGTRTFSELMTAQTTRKLLGLYHAFSRIQVGIGMQVTLLLTLELWEFQTIVRRIHCQHLQGDSQVR